jgi:glyoxylase-like metal-dependent hydrolase (beta-lactamase superfamily II)
MPKLLIRPVTIAAVAGIALACASAPRVSPAAAVYEVYAIRYATVPNFPVAALIAGTDTSRRLDIAMMVWLLKANGRSVLVDAGFHRPDLIQRWKPVDYLEPSAAVARAGTRAADVTDIIVSHVHWDHFDGVDLFPNATIWIQREEYEHHVDSAGQPLNRAIDAPNAMLLARLRREGRVRLVDGDAQEIIPGVTVYTGGKHTYQSQYAAVRIAEGTVVLASDNMYLYENLDKHLPIAQTLDSASNLRAQDRMRTLASSLRLIVPGHDPAVFERFPLVRPGVARIH